MLRAEIEEQPTSILPSLPYGGPPKLGEGIAVAGLGLCRTSIVCPGSTISSRCGAGWSRCRGGDRRLVYVPERDLSRSGQLLLHHRLRSRVATWQPGWKYLSSGVSLSYGVNPSMWQPAVHMAGRNAARRVCGVVAVGIQLAVKRSGGYLGLEAFRWNDHHVSGEV